MSGYTVADKFEFVLPTPVAFFAIKRVQVLAKMSKTGETDYTCVPFVAILDTGVRLYCVSPIDSDLFVYLSLILDS